MSKHSVPKEINIRGATLNLSVTIESNLFRIIYHCSGQIYLDKKYFHLLKLKGCMFAQKIQRVKDSLNIFHPDLLESNSKLFEDLEQFKEFRNRMAHCAFYWGKSLSEFEVWDIAEDENKFQFYDPLKYTVKEVISILDNAIKEIIPPLTKLISQVELRLQETDPRLYDLLQSADKPPE
jgi:hypothetical protein